LERSEAFDGLTSEYVDIRIKAARWFALNAEASDADMLGRLRAAEKAGWVNSALDRAINRASKQQASIVQEEVAEPSPAMTQQIRSEVTEEVTALIIHEFSPILGGLRLSAPTDVGLGYEGSETKKLVDSFGAHLRGVRDLRRAAAVPSYSEFDIASIVVDALAALTPDDQSNVHIVGPRPFVVSADRDRLLMALGNGLRNAVEATALMHGQPNPVITINWGRSGPENWLAVIDNGPGFVGQPSQALKLGVTNKTDHTGYGLAVVEQAMQSMEGRLDVSNGDAGGARFELRWYREYANSIR